MSITPHTWMITPSDVALGLFTFCNTIRVFAYVPQIMRIRQDQQGASAISYTTWGLFLISNLSTVAYGLMVVNDWRLVAVFAANAICCVAILGLTAWKRAVFKAAGKFALAAPMAVISPAEELTSRVEHENSIRPNSPKSRLHQLRVISGRAS